MSDFSRWLAVVVEIPAASTHADCTQDGGSGSNGG